ncbi:flagellar hook-associated protein FlgL [Solirubrobacter phytolaccae]|uniref:Flagellar hook-associated protein FlgL n=1 Tax=Solirubrobacter phytolaccae TaxID=1404360 RepID=A0A9X3ND58_9ACTN|nr:flagellar hook-associated protein FlgL [Solirubrobacter phytolaccae]MDA0184228.1 flagellar hook-associated protein FlgL [Solirubrobacter phytolaccae]
MRVTTSMVQRNVLADLNTLSEKLSKTQSKASSGKEITRPSDDPFNAARAMGLRQTQDANKQYTRNINDAQGWQDATESALASMTDLVGRANTLVLQGATDTADAESRLAIAAELDQIIQGIKESANATYGDTYLMGGTATDIPPYKLGADDTFQGNEAGLDPSIPGIVREIGPGVTMTINLVGREVLGDGGADGKLLSTLRQISTNLKANDGPALLADTGALKAQQDTLLNVRARNGSMTNRLTAAATRLDQIQGAVTEQLSNTEDADIVKTIIDFNSQSAAYQASLRAGANIVQTSLMDFLR